MDFHLQTLRRAATQEGTAEAWERYAAALEQQRHGLSTEDEDPVQAWIVHWYHENRVERSHIIYSRQRPTVSQVLAVGVGDSAVNRWEEAKALDESDQHHAKDPFFIFHAMGQPAFDTTDQAIFIGPYWGNTDDGLSLDGPYPITEPLPQTDDLPWRERDQDQVWSFRPWHWSFYPWDGPH